MASVCVGRNPLDLVFANQHFQQQQLQQVQGDMRDMKKLLHWIVEKERGQEAQQIGLKPLKETLKLKT
eukprot:g20169.t1